MAGLAGGPLGALLPSITADSIARGKEWARRTAWSKQSKARQLLLWCAALKGLLGNIWQASYELHLAMARTPGPYKGSHSSSIIRASMVLRPLE